MNIKRYLEKKWITDSDEISKIEDFFIQEISKESLENWEIKKDFISFMIWREFSWEPLIFWDENYEWKFEIWEKKDYNFQMKKKIISHKLFTNLKFKNTDIWIQWLVFYTDKYSNKKIWKFVKKLREKIGTELLIFLCFLAIIIFSWLMSINTIFAIPIWIIITFFLFSFLQVSFNSTNTDMGTIPTGSINNKIDDNFVVKKLWIYDDEVLKWEEEILENLLELKKYSKNNIIKIIFKKDSVEIEADWTWNKDIKEILDYYVFLKVFLKFKKNLEKFYLS